MPNRVPPNNLDEPLAREHYAEIDIDEQLTRLRQRDETETAMNHSGFDQLGRNQASDPIDMGLYIAGYPNIDSIPPTRVTVYYLSGIEVTVVVLSLGLMDDSIRDQEQRIDLRKDGDTWSVEWAGYRQRCARTGITDWVTRLCP